MIFSSYYSYSLWRKTNGIPSFVVTGSTKLLGKVRIYNFCKKKKKKMTVYQHILCVLILERLSHSFDMNYMMKIPNLNRHYKYKYKRFLHPTSCLCFTLITGDNSLALRKSFSLLWSWQCTRNTFIIDTDLLCIWFFDGIEG